MGLDELETDAEKRGPTRGQYKDKDTNSRTGSRRIDLGKGPVQAAIQLACRIGLVDISCCCRQTIGK